MMMLRKRVLCGLVMLMMVGCEKAPVDDDGILLPTAPIIYPKIRQWTSPACGEEVKFNPPSLQWPTVKNAMYNVRLSSTKNFSENLIEKKEIPFAIFNPHKILDDGTWYWQYKSNEGSWGKLDSFRIGTSTPVFETPEIADVIQNIAVSHPRVLAKNSELQSIRKRAKNYKEVSIIIQAANDHLNKPVPKEQSALPTYKGKNEFEDTKIASLASKQAGWNVFNVLNVTIPGIYFNR